MALRVGLSRVVFVLLLISFAAMATSDQCEYTVKVKTGNVPNAGTDATISLKLMSAAGNSFTIADLKSWGTNGAQYNYFERGQTDEFKGKSVCLDVCAITVFSNGLGNDPSWYLESVDVTIGGANAKEISFLVNRWLSQEPPNQLLATVNSCTSFNLKPTLSCV
ncbi:PLAT domain-containing protein 1-like [Neltuma alba]|uniref:PLAT domain-containing protein 1-like n=1 Tax=Neltuma alba TaxID=207710 RepID=UPI0010A57B40|nr:PLAT domain-containing protein 1-like [Prosopis alba]